MPLDKVMDKLSKRYNEFRLKRALNSAIDKDISAFITKQKIYIY